MVLLSKYYNLFHLLPFSFLIRIKKGNRKRDYQENSKSTFTAIAIETFYCFQETSRLRYITFLFCHVTLLHPNTTDHSSPTQLPAIRRQKMWSSNRIRLLASRAVNLKLHPDLKRLLTSIFFTAPNI